MHHRSIHSCHPLICQSPRLGVGAACPGCVVEARGVVGHVRRTLRVRLREGAVRERRAGEAKIF